MNDVYRILDVNLNRLKEGLRIVEDVVRFKIEDEKLTSEIKTLRHSIDKVFDYISIQELLKNRNIEDDFGSKSDEASFQKLTLQDILISNFKRIEEALRSLEEFSKLINFDLSKIFKEARFKAYQIEKEVIEKLQ